MPTRNAPEVLLSLGSPSVKRSDASKSGQAIHSSRTIGVNDWRIQARMDEVISSSSAVRRRRNWLRPREGIALVPRVNRFLTILGFPKDRGNSRRPNEGACGFSFCSRRYCLITLTRANRLRNEPRWIPLYMISANQRSTRLSSFPRFSRSFRKKGAGIDPAIAERAVDCTLDCHAWRRSCS